MGIDPGLAALGYGIVKFEGDKVFCIEYGSINTSSKDILPVRLTKIHNSIVSILEKFRPCAVAIERLIYCQNVRIALSMGEARGATILSVARFGSNIVEYSPTEIKQSIVGRGRADKEQMQKMVKTLLNLKEIPEPNHSADALAAALCYVFSTPLKKAIAISMEK